MTHCLLYNSVEQDVIAKQMLDNPMFTAIDLAFIEEHLRLPDKKPDLGARLKHVKETLNNASMIVNRTMNTKNYALVAFNPGVSNHEEKLAYCMIAQHLIANEAKMIGKPGVNGLAGDHYSKQELWGIAKKLASKDIHVFDYRIQKDLAPDEDWEEHAVYNPYDWQEKKTAQGHYFHIKKPPYQTIKPVFCWFHNDAYFFEPSTDAQTCELIQTFLTAMRKLIRIDLGEAILFNLDGKLYFGSLHQLIRSENIPNGILDNIINAIELKQEAV